MVQSFSYSNVYLKELSKTWRHESGKLMTWLGYEPTTSLKPLHHPALSTLLVLPYGFSFVLRTVIYRSDVLDVFLFPASAFVFFFVSFTNSRTCVGRCHLVLCAVYY